MALSSFPHGRLRSILPDRRVADIAQLPAVQPARADARLVDEIVEWVVGSQERLNPRPRHGIARTFANQNCGVVRRIVIVCSFQENGLRAHWVERHRLLRRSSTASRVRSSKRRLLPSQPKSNKKMRNGPSCRRGGANVNPLQSRQMNKFQISLEERLGYYLENNLR
jgi:hypothetical protein